MLRIDLFIDTPWIKEYFKNIFCVSGVVSKYKSYEVQCYYHSIKLITISAEISFRGKDHPGIMFKLGLVGCVIDIGLRDHRHWDYENNRWELYEQA